MERRILVVECGDVGDRTGAFGYNRGKMGAEYTAMLIKVLGNDIERNDIELVPLEGVPTRGNPNGIARYTDVDYDGTPEGMEIAVARDIKQKFGGQYDELVNVGRSQFIKIQQELIKKALHFKSSTEWLANFVE